MPSVIGEKLDWEKHAIEVGCTEVIPSKKFVTKELGINLKEKLHRRLSITGDYTKSSSRSGSRELATKMKKESDFV